MLNNGLRTYRLFHITTINQLKHLRNIQTIDKAHSCLCGQVYYKKYQRQDSSFYKNVRVHSTHSDHHRQKVVMETSSPNVIDKLDLEKVLPLDKEIVDKKTLRDRIYPYVQLARWDKPIGVYLLYWPCAWSISLATITSGAPLPAALQTAGLFLAGAVLMRGAGCTINDMWDKDIDKQWIRIANPQYGYANHLNQAICHQVARTGSRPLASGAVSYPQATSFLALQLSAALAVLLQLNCTSVALGASSLLLVISYPLSKRFTNYPQVFLGATFNWGALLGYAAVQGSVDPHICVPLYVAALAWTVVYDTIYAHQDKVDDARIGIKSTALTFGAHTKPALAAALVLSATCLSYAGVSAQLGLAYTAAVLGYTGHIGRQIYTLDVDNPADCANKFKSNSLVGLIILLGIIGGGYNTYYKNREKNIYKGDEAKSCFLG